MRRARAVAWIALAMGLGGAIILASREAARGQSRPPAAAMRERPPDRTGPSPIVYPPQRIALRMDHSLEVHRNLRCVRCHVGAGVSDHARDLLIPREDACRPCHDAELDRGGPDLAARCSVCHVGYAEGEAVPMSDFPTARIAFSHREHVDRGMRCRTCHEGVERATVADRRHLPTMRQCFECHGPPGFSVNASAPGRCDTCHSSRPDGSLHTRFAEGTMNPPSWLFDMRHDHEWLVRHRWVAADEGGRCASCHQESDCADCHDGRVRPRRVHPGDYLSTHVVSARRDQPRCQSCHEVARFCTECHARLGLSPMAAPDVRTARAYHPPRAVWTEGPNLHALEATRAMNACASCHAERDCVVCHGSLGIGAGVSPHPPGFAMGCRDALERNARACVTCHGDASALATRCR
ncbi:MAG: cytochrome c3 family protein [Sandaracinaceae bacterium]